MFLSSLSPPNSLPRLLHQDNTTGRARGGGGADVVAVAMDDNTVQAFTTDVSQSNITHP